MHHLEKLRGEAAGFSGRVEALQAVQRALSDAHACVVVGAPGSGKTALLSRVAMSFVATAAPRVNGAEGQVFVVGVRRRLAAKCRVGQRLRPCHPCSCSTSTFHWPSPATPISARALALAALRPRPCPRGAARESTCIAD